MDSILQDLRFGARMLARSPASTTIAVLVLALGAGANTAAFSMVYALLLQPLPYPRPERLMRLSIVDRDTGGEVDLSREDLDEVRRQGRAFQAVAGLQERSFVLGEGPGPQQVQGAAVSPEIFEVLGIQPERGREPFAEGALETQASVALISRGLWERRFGADPAIVGKILRLDRRSVTVAGILPSEVQFLARQVDLWIPLGRPTDDAERKGRWLAAIGRLAPGVSVDQARGELEAIASRLPPAEPRAGGRTSLQVTRLDETRGGARIRPRLLLLQGAAALVLLIACANVANVLLARASGRSGEVAIRAALGAGRRRLLQQFLAESLLLALAGGALGLLVAHWLLDALIASVPQRLARDIDFRLDGSVLALSLAVSALTGIVFGIVPALQAAATNVLGALRKGGGVSQPSFGRDRLRGMLLSTELALSLVLLVGAGLLTRAYWRLEGVEPGFDPSHGLALDLSVSEATHPLEGEVKEYYREVVERVRSLPGILAAGAVDIMPLVGWNPTTGFLAEGHERGGPGPGERADLQPVIGDYFRAMAIPILRGRSMRDGELAVAVVNERFANRVWPGEEAPGKRIRLDGEEGSPPRSWLTVVGVAGDVRQFGLQQEPRPEIYVPDFRRTMTLVVRTSGPPAVVAKAVIRAVQGVDPSLPAPAVRTLDAVVADSLSSKRLLAVCLAVLGAVALVLAALGLYGVISYSVVRRTREIGIRLALGESTRSVALILRQCAGLTLVGVAAGLGGALAVSRLLRSTLFGVSPMDAATFVGASSLLVAVALLSAWAPVRSATRLDPVVALREE